MGSNQTTEKVASNGADSILVTGGAGFIGSNFVLNWLAADGGPIVNLDKLTYAGNPANLASVAANSAYMFVHGDICDAELVARLLRAARKYYDSLTEEKRKGFRFLHVSTDEVYGTLTPEAPAFHEETPYAPNSPYAASKASSDHIVRAWVHTYGLPAIITNCSNNYGPYQFPEKLIPLMIANALQGKALPVYGDGQQVRDWLYVVDHCQALRTVLERGRVGETYNVGGGNQRSNLEVVAAVCALLDELVPESKFKPHVQLVKYVTDRPGHDRRYAIDASKLERELGWRT